MFSLVSSGYDIEIETEANTFHYVLKQLKIDQFKVSEKKLILIEISSFTWRRYIMDKFLIIDGHNLLFRMFYGIPNPIRNSDGKDIRGVIGFIGGMLKVLNLYQFDNMIIVFDSETSTVKRTELDENYKNNRIDYSKVVEEENPFSQLDYIYKVLEYLNIKHIEVDGYEADDYIASLCRLYSSYEIVILSTDRDFLQLVSENITLYSPRGKMSIEFTPTIVFEKFNINPCQMIDYKILVGDMSDNIKGVKSIGPKTAVKILSKGTLEEIMSGAVSIEEKLYSKLIKNKELINRNRQLIAMKDNIDINTDYNSMAIIFERERKTMEILNLCGIS